MIKSYHAGVERIRRKRRGMLNEGDKAPHDQYHHHDGGDLHDRHGFLAALVNALGIFSPKVKHDEDGENGGKVVGAGGGEVDGVAEISAHVVYESCQVLACGNRADWS